MPNYELFAVIANRGKNIRHMREPYTEVKDNNHYITIVKRDNGDVIEFDPKADGPKKLPDPNDILEEKDTVEMLFYKEKVFYSMDANETNKSASSSSSSESSSSNTSSGSEEGVPPKNA